jgi:O-acetylserine/cysteine efflux transporter
MLAIQWRDLLFLVLINLIWGFNFITSKVGVSELPPLWFTTLRFTLLALILAAVLRVHRGQMGAIVVAGVLSGALHFGLLFVGLGMSKTVSTVAIVGQLGVPFTTLMSIVFLGEVVRWRRWLGITLAFAGVMVMGLDPRVFDFWQGLALVVLSAFVGSIGLLAVKQLKDIKPLEIQAWFAVISVPVLAVLSAVFREWPAPGDAGGVAGGVGRAPVHGGDGESHRAQRVLLPGAALPHHQCLAAHDPLATVRRAVRCHAPGR